MPLFNGTPDADHIDGTSDADTIDGLGGDDTLNGLGGADIIGGQDGNDTIDGGDGDDILSGGAGDDLLTGGLGDDQLRGWVSGADVLRGGDGADRLDVERYSADAADFVSLYGDDGNDVIDLFLDNGGSAIVDGGAGNDTFDLEGGNGSLITVTTGSGADVINFNRLLANATPTLTITDFEAGVDQFDWSEYLSQLNMPAGANPFLTGYARLIQDGADAVLQIDRNGGADNFALTVRFQGVQATALSAEGTFGFPAVSLDFTGSNSFETVYGSFLADRLDGAANGDTLYGLGGDDTLIGGDGNDALTGGVGDDLLNGGDGVDRALYADATGGIVVDLRLAVQDVGGGQGRDTFVGIEGLVGSAFNDRLIGSDVANALVGGGGADEIDGGAGSDQLSGGDGDDILRGGSGVDVLDGGNGIDTVDYSGAATGMRAQLNSNASSNDGDGGTDTFSSIENLTGSAFNDTLIGDGVANVLRGGLGADTLLGLGGNDVIWGGSGALNTLQGGLGDDTYVLEAADSITELAGEGTDTVDARIAVYTLAANVENLVFGGTGNFTGTGNAANNTLTGGAGNDNLRGRGGVDVLNGGDGVDTVDYTLAAAGVTARLDLNRATNDGDGATDTFTGVENLTGSNFNDLLIGNGGNNVLMGGIGTDTLLGFGGDDVLMGGSGGGNNQLQGGQGNDWYILDAFDTCVEVAGEGIDTVEARIGSYTLGANIENLLYTGPGGFTGSGNALNNAITGGGQNDILKGGGGDDVINGGLGSDEVQFRGSKAQYTVTVEGSGYRIVDSVAGRDGSTLVSSIEMLRFLTGNTTTALVYPPVAPAPLETVDKDLGPLTSPIGHDDGFGLPDVLPALQAKTFEDGPQVLPQDEGKAALRALFDLHDGVGGVHALLVQPDWIPQTVEHRDWM